MPPLVLGKDGILSLLPHRDVALCVDEATINESDDSVSATGYYTVTYGKVAGHFPDNFITPAHWYIEMLAQLAGLAALTLPSLEGALANGLPALVGCGKSRFTGRTSLGDGLLLNVKLTRARSTMIMANGQIRCDDKLIATVEDLMLVVIKRPEHAPA